MVPLTELAHQHLREHLAPGDMVIDATAGNGHDTLFLSRCVGPTGQVFAVDLQQAALDATQRRLDEARAENVTLILGSHAELRDLIPCRYHGTVAAVMFNLGYLPGGDKSLITRSESTLRALDAAWQLLRPEGWLTVLAYPGHPGGQQELECVLNWRESLRNAECTEHGTERTGAPRLLLFRKSDDGMPGGLRI